MGDVFRTSVEQTNGQRQFNFKHLPLTNTPFAEALARARDGRRLSLEDGVALMTCQLDDKDRVLELANERRKQVVGDEVTFVANMNLNLTTACDVGCLFCNFKNSAALFEKGSHEEHNGFTRTPAEAHALAGEGVERGIFEICSVSGLHPALALNEEHRRLLARNPVGYKPPAVYAKDPGTYVEQLRAMKVAGVHLHAVTPEEAYHAKRGTAWSYEEVYAELKAAGLNSVPGTAAEVLVDEVREVICAAKIDTAEWLRGMEGAAKAGLPMTATIMYGHVENARHRVMHLDVVRSLQDRTGNITEFVPLKFVYPDTPLFHLGMVSHSSTRAEDELMIAVSRLYLDNVPNVQVSWVKYGDELSLHLLNCGGNDFMGTLLSEEITQRAGGQFGTFRSFQDYVDMVGSIGRVPTERSTDYEQRRVVATQPGRAVGPVLGPRADGTPLLGKGATSTATNGGKL